MLLIGSGRNAELRFSNFANQVTRDTVIPSGLDSFLSQLSESLHRIRPDLEVWVIIFKHKRPSSILVINVNLMICLFSFFQLPQAFQQCEA